MIENLDSMKEDFGGAFSPKTDADSYSTEGGLGAKRNPKDLSEIGGSSHDRYISSSRYHMRKQSNKNCQK